jgi:hypothetical protein
MQRRIASAASIAYAPGARHTLDVCRPRSATAAPVIVFFYGGGWRSGSKRTYRYVVKQLSGTTAAGRAILGSSRQPIAITGVIAGIVARAAMQPDERRRGTVRS